MTRTINLILFIILSILPLPIMIRMLGFRIFDDEADTLSAGKLMAQGSVLYKEIFSHHFPFSYYFSALIFHLGFDSIELARLSLYIFNILCFAVAAILTKQYKVIFLTSLTWLSVSHLVIGHMLIHASFSAPLIFLFFSLLLHWFTTKDSRWYFPLALGATCAVIFLNYPLAIYPVFLGALLCFVFKKDIKTAIKINCYFFLVLIIYFSHLWQTDSFYSFKEQAIDFNLKYYQVYKTIPEIPFLAISKDLLNPFGIFSTGSWDKVLFPIIYFQDNSLSTLESFLYGSVLLQLIFLAWVAFAFFVRRYAEALITYVTVCSTATTVGVLSMNAQSHMLLCIFYILYSMSKYQLTTDGDCRSFSYKTLKYLSVTYIGSLVFLSYSYTLINWKSFSYEYSFKSIEERARYYGNILPATRDMTLGIYPADPYIYYFSDFKPLSGFLYFWPWVANYGSSKVIAHLKKEKAAVNVVSSGEIWGNKLSDSYRDLMAYLNSSCFLLNGATFLSPALSSSKEFKEFFIDQSRIESLNLALPEKLKSIFGTLIPISPDIRSTPAKLIYKNFIFDSTEFHGDNSVITLSAKRSGRNVSFLIEGSNTGNISLEAYSDNTPTSSRQVVALDAFKAKLITFNFSDLKESDFKLRIAFEDGKNSTIRIAALHSFESRDFLKKPLQLLSSEHN